MIENRSGKKLRILETSERSREVSKMAAERTEPDKVVPRPNPEVAARATRRRFSARYKLRILEQADGCESGEVGALLRREGLYWSNLQAWRQQREHGTLQALTPRKRGRKSKPVNPLDRQLKRVEAENRKLKRKLEKFEAMLDLQKKVSHLLGISLARSGAKRLFLEAPVAGFQSSGWTAVKGEVGAFAEILPIPQRSPLDRAG